MKTIFFALTFLFLVSCTDREKQNNEKIKNAVTQYLNDEFFRRNLSLNLHEVRINKIETELMDTIIVKSLENIADEEFLKMKQNNPEYYEIENIQEILKSNYTNNPKWIKFKKIQNQYSSLDLGMIVYCYVKGTQVDTYNKNYNFIFDNMFFIIDSNFKVIDSGLKFSE